MEVAVPKRRRTMAVAKETLKERLVRYRQIKICVIGGKSGHTISIAVWFVLERENLYLLPDRARKRRVQERAEEPVDSY